MQVRSDGGAIPKWQRQRQRSCNDKRSKAGQYRLDQEVSVERLFWISLEPEPTDRENDGTELDDVRIEQPRDRPVKKRPSEHELVQPEESPIVQGCNLGGNS